VDESWQWWDRDLKLYRWTYQSERAKDGESFDVWKPELNQTQHDNDDVETTPLVLKVFVKAERDYFQRRLRGENTGEHL